MSGHAVSRTTCPYRDMGDGPVALLVFLPRTGALTTNNGRMNEAPRCSGVLRWRWLRRFALQARRSRA